jgi:hypothetical protein
MTNETISVDSALNGLGRVVTSQLESTISLLAQNVKNVVEAMDKEADDYNSLVDELEKLQGSSSSTELRLNSQLSLKKEEALELKDSVTSLTSQLAAEKLKNTQLSGIKKERDELKSLDPKGMKTRIARLREKSEAQLTENTRLRRDNKQYREENSILRATNSKLELAATEAHQQYNEIKSRLIAHDGDVKQKVYLGKSGLECFIYTFGYPLSFKPVTGEVQVINDFKFHIEVRTNWAINLIVSCSTWGVPFMPSSADLEGIMPAKLNDDIRDIYHDAMEENHSFLLDRIEWARSESLSDVAGLTDKQLSLLEDSGKLSVFSICHTPSAQLEADVKGMGAQSIEKVIKLVRAHVALWEQENWAKEHQGKFN